MSKKKEEITDEQWKEAYPHLDKFVRVAKTLAGLAAFAWVLWALITILSPY